MDILLGLLFWLLIGAGVKTAWDHAKADRQRGRDAKLTEAAKKAAPKQLPATQKKAIAARHATGWWASEILHGFPVHRTGWHAGWLAHETAWEQHRARREEARTSHLEARASILSGLREHRQRQAEALARIERARRQAAEPVTICGPPVPDDNDELAAKRAQRANVPPLPADTVPGTGTAAPATPPDPLPAPGGPAEPPAATSPAAGGPVPTTQPEGNKPMATEGTYTQSIQIAQKVEADAEAHLAEKPWQEMENHVDAISALMRGDTATLGDYAEVADALKDVQRAWEKAVEAAQTARANLQQRHGGIKQASDDAPVPMAKPEFYEGD
jgi:hypothetical protein